MKKFPVAIKKARKIAVQAVGEPIPHSEVWLTRRDEQPPVEETALTVCFTHPVFKETWVAGRPVLLTSAEYAEWNEWTENN